MPVSSMFQMDWGLNWYIFITFSKLVKNWSTVCLLKGTGACNVCGRRRFDWKWWKSFREAREPACPSLPFSSLPSFCGQGCQSKRQCIPQVLMVTFHFQKSLMGFFFFCNISCQCSIIGIKLLCRASDMFILLFHSTYHPEHHIKWCPAIAGLPDKFPTTSLPENTVCNTTCKDFYRDFLITIVLASTCYSPAKKILF